MQEIQQLLAVTKQLRDNPNHQGSKFSLDGKLVGDIGEVLVAQQYGIKLYNENEPIHHGEEIVTQQKVQIMASFKGYFYFPFGDDKVPDYFLAVNINEKGELEELFNGTWQYIVDYYIKTRNLKH